MALKLIVMYHRPKDIQAFETVYKNEHVPKAVEKLTGKTKIIATRGIGSANGKPAFHRIAEIHFPSMQALESCAISEGGKETVAKTSAKTWSETIPCLFFVAARFADPIVSLPPYQFARDTSERHGRSLER